MDHEGADGDVHGDAGGGRPGGVGEAGGEAHRAEEADCEETVRRLYFFLDGALTEDRRRAISHHLDLCGDCFEAFGFESELRRVVADRCKERVPDPLRERIADAIRREERARSFPAGGPPSA